MIDIYHRARKSKLDKLTELKVGAWIDVVNPDEKEIEEIVEMLKLEKDLLLDALDTFEVPRLESEDGVTYVFSRAPEVRGKEVFTTPFLIAIGEDFILTLAREKCNFLDDFRSGKKDFYTTQKTNFFVQIFSAVNAIYRNLLLDTNKRLRGMIGQLEKIDNQGIVQFVNFEKTLNDFLSALLPTNSVLEKLLDGKHIRLYEEDEDLVEDLFLGNGQLIETSKATLRHVVNIRSAYSNIMTHDLNRVMKILTALTIVLTIPTMIFSFYGMNVSLPHSSYSGITIFTILISFVMFGVFIKKRWL